MKIVWDASVSSDNQATIQAAIDACTYPLGALVTVWTVFVRPNPGHSGRNEALTTVFDATHAQTEFAPGLFIPGDALYVDGRFVEECVAHELGHVASLGKMDDIQLASFGPMFGFAYPAQWATGAWEAMGREAVAETFKDLFMPAAHRHFLNRTVHFLAQADEAAFVRLFAAVLGSPTVDHTSTTTAAMAQRLEHEYGTSAWVADMAPLGIPGVGQSSAGDLSGNNAAVVNGLYSGVWERFMEVDYAWADVAIWEAHIAADLGDIDALPDLASGIAVSVVVELLSGRLAGDFLASFNLLYLVDLPGAYTSADVVWLATGASIPHPFTIDNIAGVAPFPITTHSTDTLTADAVVHPFPDEPQAVFDHGTGLPVPDGQRILVVNHPSDVPGGGDGAYMTSGGTRSVTPPGPFHAAFEAVIGGAASNGYLELVWPTVGRAVTMGDASFTVSYTTGIAAADVAVPPWPYPPAPAPVGVPGQIAVGSQSMGVRRRPPAH